ncbi:MAG TPA: hypothetical protein VM870_10730, partial [Pyrinomonadaceae bacterium]|nr:hypothetical protein [Pyrinomonadaceae bacterium]
DRAREVLSRLERYELDVFADDAHHAPDKAAAEQQTITSNEDAALERAARTRARRSSAAQVTLFDLVNQGLIDELKGIKVQTIGDDEAKAILRQLQQRIV